MTGSGPDGSSGGPSQEFKEVIAVVEQSFLHIAAVQERIEFLEAKIEVWEAKEWQVWPHPEEKMEDWVNEWLLPTFRLEMTVGADWAEDPAVFSELAALYAGYTAMVSSDASGWDPLTWHSHKTGTMERITAHLKRNPAAAPSAGGWGTAPTTR